MNQIEKINIIKNQKYFVKKDLFVFIILAFIIIIMTAGVFVLYNKTGENACIYSNGELIKIMPLNKNDEYLYSYENHYNKIVVENGYVFIEEADCSDKVCIEMGKINKIGDSIICVPHKLKIIIEGEGNSPADL